MQPSDDFDPSAYMTVPRLDVPSQIALGWQLLALAPADLPKSAEVCKRGLLAATRVLEENYKATQLEGPSLAKRPIDLGADNSWSSVKSRLEPYTWLPEQRFPEAIQAKELLKKLFPSGLSFTLLEYGAQWAEASWRIQVIADEKLEPELRRLCGDLFIDELFHWHKEYAQMVGVIPARRGSKSSDEPRPSLAELRRNAVQAAVAWQAQLVALYLSGNKAARAALRPTDDYREKLAAAVPAKVPTEPSPPAASPSP